MRGISDRTGKASAADTARSYRVTTADPVTVCTRGVFASRRGQRHVIEPSTAEPYLYHV